MMRADLHVHSTYCDGKNKLEEMIQAAIAKAAEPKEEVTPEQIQEMVTKSVEAAVQPVLKHVGEPTNLNGSVQNQATEQHYLHGII